jgi:hypothetical protein
MAAASPCALVMLLSGAWPSALPPGTTGWISYRLRLRIVKRQGLWRRSLDQPHTQAAVPRVAMIEGGSPKIGAAKEGNGDIRSERLFGCGGGNHDHTMGTHTRA